MSFSDRAEYLGLPLPNDYEQRALQTVTLGTSNHRGLSLDDIYSAAALRAPAIDNVIKHDKDLFVEDEAPFAMPLEEVAAYCVGIDEGYKYIVGCFTYTNFLRSRHLKLPAYLDSIPGDSSELPVRGRQQLRRVKLYREAVIGDLIIDEPAYNQRAAWASQDDPDIFELSYLDRRDYVKRAAGMASLIDTFKEIRADRMEASRLAGEYDIAADTLVDSLLEGIDHGISNAVAMYIQSHEETVLSGLRRQMRV